MHSKKYEMVKYYYDQALWSLSWVRRAVKCKYITEDEFEEITGQKY